MDLKKYLKYYTDSKIHTEHYFHFNMLILKHLYLFYNVADHFQSV